MIHESALALFDNRSSDGDDDDSDDHDDDSGSIHCIFLLIDVLQRPMPGRLTGLSYIRNV